MSFGRRVGLLGVLACCCALVTPGGAWSEPVPVAGIVQLTPFDDAIPPTATWAHPTYTSTIRTYPTSSARRVASVQLLTEDGFPEVYPILDQFTDTSGRSWSRVGIPMRPNGRTGWVRTHVLGPVHTSTMQLVVSRARFRATLLQHGRVIWTSPIGVGAVSTPTPPGSFWVREKFRVSAPGGSFGPRAIGTSDYSTLSDWPGGGVIGLHGTDEPELIPGRPSHGCIRVPNNAIVALYDLLPIGTPIMIA